MYTAKDTHLASTESQTLCTSCGVCCKGYALDHCSINKEEAEALKKTDVNVYKHCDNYYFSIPCSAIENNCCTVYSSRPQACRKFECRLLRRVASKEIELADALEIVDKFNNIMEQLRKDEIYPEIASESVFVKKNLRRINELLLNADNTSLKVKYGKTSLLLGVAERFLQDEFGYGLNSLFARRSAEVIFASLSPVISKDTGRHGDKREQKTFQEVADINFWRAFMPSLNISEPASFVDACSCDFSESELGEARTSLILEGYFQKKCKWAADCSEMAKLARRLSDTNLPSVFAFVYDEFWLPFFQLRPVLSSVLGVDYLILPDFWVWNIDPAKGEAGWKPHRDKGRRSLDEDGSPKSVTVWIPLSEATPLNGCMYLVPAYLDPTYNTDRESKYEFEYSSIRALPGGPGDFFIWNQAVCHWGGKSSPKATASRVSMAVEFQRADVQAFNRPLILPASPPSFQARLKLIAKQILQYQHMYRVDREIIELAERIGVN